MSDQPPKDPDPWTTSYTSVRQAAKWSLVTLGALAVGIFGAAPAIRGFTLSWSDPDDQAQLVAAILFGAVGLSAMLALVFVVARTLIPVFVTLGTVSAETKTLIRSDPGRYLPPDLNSATELADRISSTLKVLAVLQTRVDSPAAPAADAQIDPAKLKARQDKAAADVASMKAYLQNLELWRERVLRVDTFYKIRASFLTPLGRYSLPVLVGAAAIGALGFMFAVSAPAASPAATAAQVGYLTKGSDAAAATELWKDVGLGPCEDAKQRVPVVILSQKGSTSTVETISRSTCQPWQFNVVPASATLTIVQPKKVSISYK